MKKVRIGVIGAGWWATFVHIPAVKSHPHAGLVAVQSRERAKAEIIACESAQTGRNQKIRIVKNNGARS
jgi:predicted dehydrogenase